MLTNLASSVESSRTRGVIHRAINFEIGTGRNIDRINFWLDKLYELDYLACSHHSYGWGFNPYDWMIEERIKLAERGGKNWPREVI